MVAVAYASEHDPDVPADENVVTCDVHVLAAAFRLAYLAGRAEAARSEETLVFLRRTLQNMKRSLRRALPAPREGVEAGLDLMLLAVDERLAR